MLNRLLHLLQIRHPDWRYHAGSGQMRRYIRGWQYKAPADADVLEFNEQTMW